MGSNGTSSVLEEQIMSSSGGASTKNDEPVVAFIRRHQSFKDNKAPAPEKEEIRRVFDHFDENKDGLISEEDLHHFMHRLGFQVTKEDIAAMVSSVDVNGDGSVDFKEFASLYETLSSENPSEDWEKFEEEDLKKAFHVFDADHDGFITPSELQAVLVNLGMSEGRSLANCETMIQSVDIDGNGQVDFLEFKKLMSADFARG